MTYAQVDKTYLHHLSKPETRAKLETYAHCSDEDNNNETFIRYYNDIFGILEPTPCFGVTGTNVMLNGLTKSLYNTLTRAKRGKTSARSHARALIQKLDYWKDKDLNLRGMPREVLIPRIPNDLLQQMAKAS